MKQLKNHNTFFLGLLFSLLVTVIVWYWYKSTSAEEGALDLLDRMAQTEARLRQAQANREEGEPLPARYISLENHNTVSGETAVSSADDLQEVKGIGPVFAQRLNAAGVHTLAELVALSASQIAAMLDIPEGRAEAILAEAYGLV